MDDDPEQKIITLMGQTASTQAMAEHGINIHGNSNIIVGGDLHVTYQFAHRDQKTDRDTE